MSDIADSDLRRIDLNLLVVFAALIEERSATRAGRRLGLSQAAVSGALARLRRTFQDPLFTRAPGGLAPTPRALELATRLTPALAALADVVRRPHTFDPAGQERAFTIGMSDDIEAFLMPALVGALLREHPGITIRARQTNRHLVERMLDAGDIDLAVVAAPELSSAHRRERLFDSGYVTLLDPALDAELPLSLDAFLALPHVLVSFDGRRGVVDDALDALGRTRHVAASTTHFAGSIALVKAIGAVVTMPEPAGRVFARELGLALSPPPVELPSFTVSLAWHSLRTPDPAHAWLRRRVRAASG